MVRIDPNTAIVAGIMAIKPEQAPPKKLKKPLSPHPPKGTDRININGKTTVTPKIKARFLDKNFIKFLLI